jgi:hypothetical protein
MKVLRRTGLRAVVKLLATASSENVLEFAHEGVNRNLAYTKPNLSPFYPHLKVSERFRSYF